MVTFFLFLAFAGGLIGLAGIILGQTTVGVPALGMIGLGCLAGIFARVQQATNQHEEISERLDALSKTMQGR